MNIVNPFCWTISDQILAASPSLLPWKPVWAIASRSSETLFGPTSIAFSGYWRYFFAFLSLDRPCLFFLSHDPALESTAL